MLHLCLNYCIYVRWADDIVAVPGRVWTRDDGGRRALESQCSSATIISLAQEKRGLSVSEVEFCYFACLNR